jgi:hypothetical protein
MRPSYEDIIARAGPPDWHDENGVPRYGQFKPHRVANLYAREVALLQIRCRGCDAGFRVAVSRPNASPVPNAPLSELIYSGRLSYGDPPNVECCSKGQFAGSITEQILEYWRSSGARNGWVRDSGFEARTEPPEAMDRSTLSIHRDNALDPQP